MCKRARCFEHFWVCWRAWWAFLGCNSRGTCTRWVLRKNLENAWSENWDWSHNGFHYWGIWWGYFKFTQWARTVEHIKHRELKHQGNEMRHEKGGKIVLQKHHISISYRKLFLMIIGRCSESVQMICKIWEQMWCFLFIFLGSK